MRIIQAAPKVKSSTWAIIFNEQNEILIAKRSSKVNNPNLKNLPGGGIKDGEDKLSALYREIKEEIGINKSKLVLLSRFRVTQKDLLLHCGVFEVNNAKVKLNNESSKYWWYSIDKIVNSLSKDDWHKPTYLIFKNTNVIEKLRSMRY